MGIQSLPRLYFKGQFYWSPSTYNNNDKAPAIQQYDPVTAKLDWSFLREQGVNNDEEFKKWSITAVSGAPSNPINFPPAEWGYYGGMQSGFVTENVPKIRDDNFTIPLGPNRSRTTTTGFTNDKMEYKKEDSWVDLPLNFNLNFKPAKLVDINPTLPWTSQVFSDTFTIGDKAKGEGFTAPVKYRMHSRWLYTNRNYNADGKLIIAGVISTFFQTVVHKEEIEFFNSNPKANSYQAQLQKGLETSDGIMIRFTAYDTIYFQGKPFEALHKKANLGNQNDSDQESELESRIAILYQKYEQQLKEYNEGKITEKPVPPVNRAYSRVVGWTGLWHKDELISMADGRQLLPSVLAGQPDGLPVPGSVSAMGLPQSYYFTQPGDSGPKSEVSIGPANVGISENKGEIERITVDIGTSIPERDSTGKKANFGRVQLKVYDLATKDYHDIVTIPNNLKSYQQTAGVFDFDISGLSEDVKNLLSNNPLAIFVDSYDNDKKTVSPTLALIENPLIANTNSRGVYVNQPDPYWEDNTPDVEFTIKVQHYGKPPADGDIKLAIGQYTSNFAIINESSDTNSSREYEFTDRPFVELLYENKPISNSTEIQVPEDGLITLKVNALQPGMPFLVFYPIAKDSGFTGPLDFPGPPAPVLFYPYNAIRSLPFHNILAEEFETWLSSLPAPSDVHDLIGRVNQRVFDDVYRTFHLMYPVMGFIGCPMKFQEWRGRILKLTDPNEFNSAAYMPVTRSLSTGQRRILVAYTEFLDKLPTFTFDSVSMEKAHKFRR